ncbi:hypothetical protein GCM10009097_59790 [Pigmentiphaga daeguensis]|uniref:Uncharacterized protein n=1 Tax=Pigmentiphaga daeguensis TaxID=414049 RepID=A0ABN1D672_9BURK
MGGVLKRTMNHAANNAVTIGHYLVRIPANVTDDSGNVTDVPGR